MNLINMQNISGSADLENKLLSWTKQGLIIISTQNYTSDERPDG